MKRRQESNENRYHVDEVLAMDSLDEVLAMDSHPTFRHFAPCPRETTRSCAALVVSFRPDPFPYRLQSSLHWTYLYWETKFHPAGQALVKTTQQMKREHRLSEK